MSLKIDRVELEIVIKNDESRKQLRQIEDQMRSVRKELKKLPEGSDEWIKKSAQLKELQSRYDAIYEKIGLTGLSIKELRQRQNELNAIIKQLPGNSPLLERYRKQATEVSARIRELNGQASNTGLSLSKMANGINKYFTMATAGIATITGLSFALKKVRDGAAQLDEAYADVMKTTGMSKDEVHEMNEELKKVDTRTSREELNKIAEEGGRIGVAKEDILSFTKAMDVANVALGDSFSSVEEIASKLGKLKSLFGETKDMEIEKAYLSIGSSINELGANGAATELNIAEFTTRMGSLPDAIKPSIADTLALGAAFEESGIEAEIGSRAYNIFMKQAATNADKFGKVMGKSRQEVEDLINANPLDFFLKFSESMKGMNATETAKTLDALGVNADGANKAIGAAANNTERFRELMELSNKSFKDGTSVINEFNIKNNTMEALKEKAIKSFQDETEVLGQKLNPVFTQSTNLATLFIRVLIKLPAILKEALPWVAALTVAYLAYNASVIKSTISSKADIAWKKIQELWTNRVTIAQKILNVVLKNNPIGFVITLISLLVAGYITWYNHSVKVQAVTQGLFAAIKVVGKHLVEYWTGVWKIISGAATLDPKRIKEGINSLKSSMTNWGDDIATAYQTAYDNRMKQWQEDQKKPSKSKAPKKTKNSVVVTSDDTDNDGGGHALDSSSSGTESKEQQKVNDELKKLETSNLEEIKKIKEQYLDGEIASEVDYNQKLLSLQDKYDKDRVSKLEALKGSITDPTVKSEVLNQIADINKGILDRQIEQNEKIKKIILDADPRKAEEQEYESRLREVGLFGVAKEKMTADQLSAFELLEKQHNEKMRKLSSKDAALALDKLETDQSKEEAALAARRTKEGMSEQQYKDELLKIELDFLNKKLSIQGLSDDQTETIAKQFQDKQNDITTKGIEDRQALLEKYGLNKVKDQKEAELAILKYYEKKGTLTHEEAEEVKKQITAKYLKQRLEETEQYFEAAGNLASTGSDTFSNFQSADEQRVETKYQKLIDAAEANGEDTTDLEEKKEKELAEVKAKYADQQFIMTVAQTISQTAVSAMNAYASASAIPVIGYILGPIAAAAAVAYGASQIAVAKQQRDAAKAGYKIGGFTSSAGSDDKEVGVVHANEFVNSAESVRNPSVRKFLDVFDVAQKNGTIRMLNTTQILEQTKLTGGSRKSGGYTSDVLSLAGGTASGGKSGSQADISVLLQQNASMYAKLIARLDTPLQAESVISGSNGSYEMTEKYKKLLKNASRG